MYKRSSSWDHGPYPRLTGELTHSVSGVNEWPTLVRTGVDGINILGRNTWGVKLINLGEDQKLAGIERIWVAGGGKAATANVPDFHAAGGVPAVMKEILPLLHGDALTVSGQTVAENVVTAETTNRGVIRTLADPWSAQGGLAILRGNLAPNTAITKPAAIRPDMHNFTGPARCFDSEASAQEAILGGVVQPGEVIVIRYEGPKGGPGMREMYMAMKLLYGTGLALQTALVTDGRFSGTNNGCFVGHISPEAAEGGPLAIWRKLQPDLRCFRWYGIKKSFYGILHEVKYKPYLPLSTVLRIAPSSPTAQP